MFYLYKVFLPIMDIKIMIQYVYKTNNEKKHLYYKQ